MKLCQRCSKNEPPPKSRWCRKCSKEYIDKVKETRILAGLCKMCGKFPFEESRKFCKQCLEYGVEKNKKLRLEVLDAYGGRFCKCCGETILPFLTIDHVNNDAYKERKLGIRKTLTIYAYLKKMGYPPGFQVLCFNCNCGKNVNGGVCPHVSQITPQS